MDKIEMVMLVDDNDIDNFINRRIIEISNFANRVVVQNSGQDALQYLDENKNQLDALPDLILLDINMPIVNGFVFLFEFGNLPKTIKEKSKIIILSSSAHRAEINRIIDNDHVIKFIMKPLTMEELKEINILMHKPSTASSIDRFASIQTAKK